MFSLSLAGALTVVAAKIAFNALGWEPIQQSSLHNAAISSVILVMAFLLSVTITDYKESERIPAEFAATIEDMFDDAKSIHESYPVFDIDEFKKTLRAIAVGFGMDSRGDTYDLRHDIRRLQTFYIIMERGKVPPNFIVKLKQQQAVLLRLRHRVEYIQRITSIPSAMLFSRTIVAAATILLLLTKVEPFYGSVAIIGIVSYVLIFMLLLVKMISTPFHPEGITKDDVSLFLLEETVAYLDTSSSNSYDKANTKKSKGA